MYITRLSLPFPQVNSHLKKKENTSYKSLKSVKNNKKRPIMCKQKICKDRYARS